MITTVLLVFLGALLALVVWQMAKGSGGGKQASPRASVEVPASPPPASGANVDLTSARPGDVISIPGAASDFSDVDFTIDRRSAYEHLNRRWIDLSGEFRGERVWLEVHPGGESLVVAILDPRRLSLPELGTSEEELARMDQRQDPGESVGFEGKRWQYESSREIGYFENETGSGEGLYRWTFREVGGSRLLVVEKWEGMPFEGRVALQVNPRDVTVFRAA